jgi:predicted lipoprotein with Yx(FWY)xxD motif
MPVVAVPVAGVGIVLGIAVAAHSSGPASPANDPTSPMVLADQAAAPATSPLAPNSPGPDPEENSTRPAPAHVKTSGGRMSDANGATVYTFSGDKPGVSNCTGACAKTWLPVRSPGGKPQADTGLSQSALGSMQRPDGSQQVTLDGLPLYYYAGDGAPGAAAGQGKNDFGGTWTAVAPPAPSGKPGAAPSTTGTK